MDGLGSTPTSGVRNAIEIAIPLLLIGGLLFWCFKILSPFVPLIVWGGVTALALQPLVSRLASLLGGRTKLAITLLVLLGFAILFIPVFMIADSLVATVTGIAEEVQTDSVTVPPPPAKVADWPLIGERVHGAWLAASKNLESFLRLHLPQVKEISSTVFGKLADASVGIVQFAISLVIAAVLLLNPVGISAAFKRLANRLVGPAGNGSELVDLSVATVRTVATGVLGVAFIQAVLAGVGMILFGVPGAGLIALLVLLLAIAQLPPILVLLPVALWMFGTSDSQAAAWAFFIYCLVVSFSDMALKPLLLGRGVDVPMLVVLLGAIGGLVAGGIIGLFVGAVILALGYKLFQAWLAVGADINGAEIAE